jgi:hypothetical protein
LYGSARCNRSSSNREISEINEEQEKIKFINENEEEFR